MGDVLILVAGWLQEIGVGREWCLRTGSQIVVGTGEGVG